jgi:hypothetical protein
MRAYTIAASAVTLGVSKKWLDNVLSHHRVPGVFQSKQGIPRRITPPALLALEIAARLGRGFAIPFAEALEIATQLIESQEDAIELPEALLIRFSANVEAISRELNDRLERAVEMSPNPRRGRPRRKKARK